MKVHEYPILVHASDEYWAIRLKRACLFPLKMCDFVLRVPVHVVALFLQLRHADRRDPPSWPLRWIMRASTRTKPRILVCMPFRVEPCENAYRYVVQPLVERHLGGKCVRFSHPIDGDWRVALRRELLHSTIVVFDMSFHNQNVDLERRYYASIVRSIGLFERKFIEIMYVEQHDGGFMDGKSIVGGVIHYNDDLIGLMDLADHLRQEMESNLADLRFQRGIVHPWVLFPMAPWEVPDDVTWIDGRTAYGLIEDWVENEELPDDISRLGN